MKPGLRQNRGRMPASVVPDAELRQAGPEAADAAAQRESRPPAQVLRLSRLAVLRNLSVIGIVATGAVSVVLLVLLKDGRSPATARTQAAMPPGTPLPEPNPEGLLLKDNSAYFAFDPLNPGLLVKPELYVETPFTYACGHEGKFVPADYGILGERTPEKLLAELQASVCYKCRELLEYGKDSRAQKQEGEAR
jgi:hypothetical protein